MSQLTLIGRYKIIKELGRGAMSVVYQAEDPDIGRMLAIKLLKHELIEQEDYQELFVSEAKSAGRLSHPSIVTIYDTGIWNGRPFIAMELLQGVTLDQYLFDKGVLDLNELLILARKLASALDYAHRQGVIHRDLKPENIFVLNDGAEFKITDFGIAKVESGYLEEQKAAANESDRDDKIMGTPAYMSPEQITGHGVDAKTDFYSLGVILYQASKGELPFKAVNYAAMLQAVLQQNPESLNLSSEEGLVWQSIVFRLLQKNPDLRYDSAITLIDELDKLEREYQENQKGLAAVKFVSLGTKWSLLLSALVFVVMILGMFWVYKKQTNLMEQLMFDYGFSVTEIVNNETAEPLLLDEDLTLQSIVNKIASNNQILALSIRDKSDRVIASNQVSELKKVFQQSSQQKVEARLQGDIYLDENSFKELAYRFDSPIIYQNKEVGRVNLALSQSNLQQTTNSSLMTMIVWMFLILLAVFLGIYWLVKRFVKRINASRQRLHDIRVYGQAEAISIAQHDEIGRMEQEVNLLSQKIAGLTRTQRITLVDLEADISAELQANRDLDKTLVIGAKSKKHKNSKESS